MFLGHHILTLFLFMQYSTVSCDTFYIVTSPSSPCPGEYIGVPCLTLQQYASNPSQSQNITLIVEPGVYNLSTVLTVSDGHNFTMSSTNATVTCTSATAQFDFSTVENVHISGITFQGCRNTAIRMLQVTSASIVSSSFADNQASSSGSSRSGGCLYITSSSVTVSESEFHNNQASDGGCLFITSSLITISESEFRNNGADYSGGIIFVASSTIKIDRSQFSFNTVTQENYFGSAGAIHVLYSNLTIDSSVFDNNNGGIGGVIYHYLGSFQITNATFFNNRARTGSGGTLYATQVLANSSVSQCQFINNTASGSGGAIYTSGSSVPITQCQFLTT